MTEHDRELDDGAAAAARRGGRLTRTLALGRWFPLALCVAVGMSIAGCAHYAHHVPPPTSAADHPPEFSPDSPPPPGKVPALSVDSIDLFLATAAATPRSETEAIRKEISRVATDPHIVDALAARLLALPVKDIDRHLMILATLGEMQNARAIEPLVQFIWSDRPLVVEPSPDRDSHVDTSYFNHTGALQARAVEMLAYIGTSDASTATLHVAAQHGATEVRIAAIDAYLFNKQDSPEAMAAVAKVVRPEEVKLIGIPRWTAHMDAQAFDARIAAFYQRYPEELPPAPMARGETGGAQHPSLPGHRVRPQDEK